MKSVILAHARDKTALSATLVASLLSCFTASAQPTSSSTQAAPAQNTPQATSQSPPDQVLKAWQETMSRNPRPKIGCFKSSYPSTDWQEVPCTTAPHRPYSPAPELKWIAGAAGPISQAVGSFDSVTGVTSEYDSYSGKADTFSLQLNTNYFTPSLCGGSKDCSGWQQFLFSSNCGIDDSTGYIKSCIWVQYWLLGYIGHNRPNCPSSVWQPYPAKSPVDCMWNSPAKDILPAPAITDLAQLSLIGLASSGGTDWVMMSTGSNFYAAPGDNIFPDLSRVWEGTEFNVFGDGNKSQAKFNSGSSLVVRLSLNDGAISAPDCVPLPSFTAETNNLTLGRTSLQVDERMEGLPAIVFTETNAAAAMLGYCAKVPSDGTVLASLIFRLLKR